MKTVSILAVVLITLTGAFFIFNNKPQPKEASVQKSTSLPTIVDEKVDIKASFIIITGTITRSFKAEKYHNQSSEVYIQSDDPKVIHVKKAGITYDDFFKTLPMKLSKDCLVTGDGENLCSESSGTLKFFLNDIETPYLLEKEIKEGDKALIKFIY